VPPEEPKLPGGAMVDQSVPCGVCFVIRVFVIQFSSNECIALRVIGSVITFNHRIDQAFFVSALCAVRYE
jgi:hypothetical protein